MTIARWLGATAMLVLTCVTDTGPLKADGIDSGSDPWERCAQCHGLFGDGNAIKFPRLAGQKRSYIEKQLRDFRQGRRSNDGGQMQKTATEIDESEIPKVAEWFAGQTPPWPKPTLDTETDIERGKRLATKGAGGLKACLSCHSHTQLGLLDKPLVAPRIAGQYDYYLVKQLSEYRSGARKDNDPDQMMTEIAKNLSDADIRAVAVYLSQNPQLHDEPTP